MAVVCFVLISVMNVPCYGLTASFFLYYVLDDRPCGNSEIPNSLHNEFVKANQFDSVAIRKARG